MTPGGLTFQAPPPSQVFGAQRLSTAMGSAEAVPARRQTNRSHRVPLMRGWRIGTPRLRPPRPGVRLGTQSAATAPRPAPCDADQTPLERDGMRRSVAAEWGGSMIIVLVALGDFQMRDAWRVIALRLDTNTRLESS